MKDTKKRTYIIDPQSSLIKVDLPLGEEVFESQVFINKIEETKIRTFIMRWRNFNEWERETKTRKEKSLSQENLSQNEKDFETYRNFLLEITKEIFFSESVEFISDIETCEGKKVSKEDLSFWLEGDFLFVWGKLFYYLLESNRIAVKKKLD